MSKPRLFPFEKARRVSVAEVTVARRAIEQALGQKRKKRGRPRKGASKFRPVSIRLHPLILEWAKREARRKGVGYQTIINDELLKLAA